MKRCAVFAPLLLVFPLSAAAQTAQPPTISTQSSLVVIPTLVRDAHGQLVYGLTADQFLLLDDGTPQTLHLEEDTGGEPIALAVVIEAEAGQRLAGWHPYKHAKPTDRFRGVPAMVEAMVAAVPHQVAVIGFDSHPELELDFTSNFDRVADTIDQLDQGNAGDRGAGILDSLIFAVDRLRHAPPGYRRAILLLSETNDRGSTHTFDEALKAISETNTAIYSVAFSTPFHEASEFGNRELPTKAMSFADLSERKAAEQAEGPPPAANTAELSSTAELVAQRILQTALFGVTLENPTPYAAGGCMATPTNPHRDPNTPVPPGEYMLRAFHCLGQLAPPVALAHLALIAATDSMRRNVPRSVAQLTGGEYFEFNEARTLEEELATLSNHLPNRYILSFQPQQPHPGVHVLQLRLRDYPQLTITARTTYWADGQSAAAPAVGGKAAATANPPQP
jgi:VWFA-related protein